MRVELRVLRYFLAVARAGSVSAAAQALNITQPTLSRQLAELEAALGKTLFLRGSRRIALTEEGAFLLRRAQEIVDLADKTQADLCASDEMITGEVYIGGGETDAMRLIARAIARLRAECPLIRFHLHSGNAEDVTERLDKGLLDFGLLIGTLDARKYDSLLLPQADTWGLLMRRDSPLAALDGIPPDALRGVPLLASRQAMLRGELSGWVGGGAESLNIAVSYNLIYNAAILVEEGMGYALCLDKLANTGPDSPLCFRPLTPRMEARLHLVWKKHPAFSKAATRFLQTMQASLLTNHPR